MKKWVLLSRLLLATWTQILVLYSLQDLPWTCFSILFSDRTRGSTVQPIWGETLMNSGGKDGSFLSPLPCFEKRPAFLSGSRWPPTKKTLADSLVEAGYGGAISNGVWALIFYGLNRKNKKLLCGGYCISMIYGSNLANYRCIEPFWKKFLFSFRCTLLLLHCSKLPCWSYTYVGVKLWIWLKIIPFRTCGVISSKSPKNMLKSKHLIDLIPSLIPSQVWGLSKLTKLSDADYSSHPKFSWTTPQKNGMEPHRWTPGTLEALQNWVNEVYVMVTWYQLFPSCFPLNLHIRYISHDKTSPKMFLKGLRFKGHVPTLHHVAPRSRRSQVLVPGPAVLFDWTQQLRLVHHWGAGKTTTELTGEPVG